MKGIQGVALSSIRAGKKYRLTNYGEVYEFTVKDIISDTDFNLYDLHTLERFKMSDVLQFGKGDDYSIWEL
jgi:hypothetical protein